jgi:hypothetical protein
MLRAFSKCLSPLLSVLFVQACVSSAPPPRPLDLPFDRRYAASFDTVWSATSQVLDIYAVVRIDRDAGLIETDWTEARFNKALYDHPEFKDIMESVKYRLKVKLSKGFIAQTGKPATRVQIVKELSEGRNFISEYDRVPTDQIEEKILLYRIDQRIKIAEMLRRKSVGSKNSEPKSVDP